MESSSYEYKHMNHFNEWIKDQKIDKTMTPEDLEKFIHYAETIRKSKSVTNTVKANTLLFSYAFNKYLKDTDHVEA